MSQGMKDREHVLADELAAAYQRGYAEAKAQAHKLAEAARTYLLYQRMDTADVAEKVIYSHFLAIRDALDAWDKAQEDVGV